MSKMTKLSSNVATWTTVVSCIAVILFCAVLTPALHRLSIASALERFENNINIPPAASPPQSNNANTIPSNKSMQSASMPDPNVFDSRRNTLIKSMIMNLFFYCSYPNMQATTKNDIASLYDGVKDQFHMQMSSFDILCQSIEVSSPAMKSKLNDACNKYFIDLFSHRERSLYPSFDATYTEVMDAAMHKDNSVFLVDSNSYSITKNFYSPRYVKYTYDTNNSLVRVNFYNNQGISRPTYFILSMPFAIEYEQFGIFNIIYDVNSDFNIMNHYSSDSDNTDRALYLSPTPNKDENNNMLNYLENNYALSQVATTLDTATQYNQMKLFYADHFKQGVNTKEYHALTIMLTPSSKGSLSMTYSGNQTSFVNATAVSFRDRELSITVDATSYSKFLADVNSTLAADSTKDFHLFLTMSFNIITIVLMYKKSSHEHHVLVKRTKLLLTDEKTASMRVFAFDKHLASPTGYVHGHNKTFDVTQKVPSMLRLSQTLGYSFRT